MKIIFSIACAVMLSCAVGAQDFKKELVGSVGAYKIKIVLERKGDLIRGVYSYDRVGKPIILKGRATPNGEMQVDEFDEKGANTGRFTLRLKGESLRGDWKGGKKTLAVALYNAAQVELIETSLSANGDLSMCVVDGKVQWLSIATTTKSGANVYLCNLDIDRDNAPSDDNVETWSDGGQKTNVIISTNYEGKKEKAGEIVIEKQSDQSYNIALAIEQHARFCGFNGVLPSQITLVKKGSKWTIKS